MEEKPPEMPNPIKFPQVPLNPGEQLWLSAAYSHWEKGDKINPRQLYIELLGKIPEDFEFERIDRRLFVDMELTLLGILHVDPSSRLAADTDRVIRYIRELILRGETKVASEDVSEGLGIPEERVTIIFGLMRNLGSFWNGLTPHPTFGGYSTMAFEALNVVREYLNYKGLEESLEKFNRLASPVTYPLGSKEVVPLRKSETETAFDVCLSFAGEDRQYVERVAAALKKANVSVFYDGYEEVELWGKDLYQHLDLIYRTKAHYCVIFISDAYARKLWTKHELKSAQARAFEENREYILPVRFDDTELAGVLKTTKYIDIRNKSPEELATLIIEKIDREASTGEGGMPEASGIEEPPWKNLTKLELVRKHLSQPITDCQEYYALVERLVESNKWSYSGDLPYPRELRVKEEQFDNSIASFSDELRSAADEIHEMNTRIQPEWLKQVAPNELGTVSKALRTASAAVYGLKSLRAEIRKGLDRQGLLSSKEYKFAVESLNGIEDSIDVAREADRTKMAFFNNLMKRGAT